MKTTVEAFWFKNWKKKDAKVSVINCEATAKDRVTKHNSNTDA